MFGWLKRKRIRIEVRDHNCNLLAVEHITIKNWNEVMEIGSAIAQRVMIQYQGEDYVDEVYWRYVEE